MLPSPYSERLIATQVEGAYPNNKSRWMKIDEIVAKCRMVYPKMFWSKEEAEQRMKEWNSVRHEREGRKNSALTKEK